VRRLATGGIRWPGGKLRLMALPPGPANLAYERDVRMAQQSAPDAPMYEVEWQRNGKGVVRLYIHAANEADALTQAEDFFTRFPALDFHRGHAGTTVNVRLDATVAEDPWEEL